MDDLQKSALRDILIRMKAAVDAAAPSGETYFLCPIPPPGQKSTWLCSYCGRHRDKHAENLRCPQVVYPEIQP